MVIYFLLFFLLLSFVISLALFPRIYASVDVHAQNYPTSAHSSCSKRTLSAFEDGQAVIGVRTQWMFVARSKKTVIIIRKTYHHTRTRKRSIIHSIGVNDVLPF